MVADLNPFCFSLVMEGGVLLRVKSRLHGTLKNFQGKYLYGEGAVLKRVPFSLLYLVYLKKVCFDFTDFINVLMPDVG